MLLSFLDTRNNPSSQFENFSVSFQSSERLCQHLTAFKKREQEQVKGALRERSELLLHSQQALAFREVLLSGRGPDSRAAGME